jgi:hypothetical protein
MLEKIKSASGKVFTFTGMQNSVQSSKDKMTLIFANSQKVSRFEYSELGRDPEIMV